MFPNLRLPTMDQFNRVFTAATVGWGAIVGSVISFLFSGAILWAIFRLFQGRIRFPTDRSVLLIGTAFGLYFAAEALAGLVSFEGTPTLIKVGENLPFLGFLLVYARLALTCRDDVLTSCEIGIITGSFGAFAFAAYQVFLDGAGRAEGMAGNPGPFAVLCSVIYGMCIFISMRRNDRMQLWAGLAAIAAAGALLLSGMRSLWPMLLVAPVIAVAIGRPNLRWQGSQKLALGIVASSMAVLFLSFDLVSTRVQSFIGDYESISEGDYANSLGYRLRLWEAAAELASKQPIFGYGPGGAEVQVAQRIVEAEIGVNFSHSHNFVLDTMISSGLIGLAALLFMFAAPLWIAARRKRDNVADFGFMLMVTTTASYFFSGIVGIMLGHDILDAFFIYCFIVGSYLVLGASENTGET